MFTLKQKLAYYRRNPHLKRRYQARWRANKRRRDEIEAAKQVLLSAHRLRLIGVQIGCDPMKPSFDSWNVGPRYGRLAAAE